MKGQGVRSLFRAKDHERRWQAERIGKVFPCRLVMWGAYSRQLWANRRFGVRRGTIAQAADPGDLTASMRAIETAAQHWPWRPA